MEDISRNTVEEAASGNIKAFEQIYRAASAFVYTVAFRITQSRQDAEEVTQDVFLKIHKHLGRFDFRSSVKTWIYRIAVNMAINRYNKMKRERKNITEEDIDLDAVQPYGDAHMPVQPKEDRKDIEKLLNVLNPDQRACLMLREVEGLTYIEIAQALQIPVNTVRTRLKRARLALVYAIREEV